MTPAAGAATLAVCPKPPEFQMTIRPLVLALSLAGEGCRVVLCGRHQAALDEAADCLADS